MEKQEQNSICREIGARTGGDIYIGVVGPVRSGKSTFIKRFMEQLVLPAMSGSAAARERARDELPQSAAGRTIMTPSRNSSRRPPCPCSWRAAGRAGCG